MTGCVLLASVPAAPSEPIGSGRVRFTRSSGGGGIRTHGDVAATMVFKSVRDSLSATVPTWASSVSAFYVIQDHPVHIP
jgi:hypothetical protein